MKKFTYFVNEIEIIGTDTEAFGTVWTKAKAVAKEKNAYITRIVTNGEEERYEFFAKGGCFLNKRFFNKERVNVF